MKHEFLGCSNNSIKYTDPSGYYVSGGYGYYDNNLSSYTNKLYQDSAEVNSGFQPVTIPEQSSPLNQITGFSGAVRRSETENRKCMRKVQKNMAN